MVVLSEDSLLRILGNLLVRLLLDNLRYFSFCRFLNECGSDFWKKFLWRLRIFKEIKFLRFLVRFLERLFFEILRWMSLSVLLLNMKRFLENLFWLMFIDFNGGSDVGSRDLNLLYEMLNEIRFVSCLMELEILFVRFIFDRLSFLILLWELYWIFV